MKCISDISVILPSYDPSEKLLNVLQNVVKQGFSSIIVIDDGSKEEFSPIFERAAEIEGCTVLRHEVNKGKGAALKTGMAFFLQNRPCGAGVITIDDDGQHLPEDVRLCAESMLDSGIFTLGVRRLKNSGAPLKSKFGNGLTAIVFRCGVGLDISDTQTGLRAIPRSYIETFLDVPGSRFEYETNMLLAVKKEKLKIAELPITAVYTDDNKNTHFRVFNDSLVIYFQFLKYAASSILAAGIDVLCFFLLLILFTDAFHLSGWASITLSTFIARGVSSMCNFLFNKNIVFGRRNETSGSMMLKYYALCITVMLLSSQLVALASHAPFITGKGFVTLSKLVIDTSLFVLNYFIQKKWVFK